MAGKPVLVTSPTIFVRADVSIRECIRLMREHKAGSVLVVHDTADARLEGIFTERDALDHLETIAEAGNLDRPIRTVMTNKTVTLPMGQIDQAAEIMLRHGFRHIPIVDSVKGQHVVGMISMRDLFREFVQGATQEKIKALEAVKKENRLLGVVANAPHFVRLLSECFAALPKMAIQHFTREDILPIVEHLGDLSKARVLILDLDDLKPPEWSELLRSLSRTKLFAVAMYDPTLNPPNVVEVLKKLRNAETFAIFPKPVSIGTLRQVLERQLKQ